MATAPAQIRNPFRAILLAVQAQLIASLEWDAVRVPIVADDEADVPHLMGDQDVLIRVMGETPDAPQIVSAGRYDNRRERKAVIIMRSRVLLDVVGRSDIRLTDQTLGLLALEDAVCDAMELFFVTDANQDLIAAYPPRMGALSAPMRSRRHKEWVHSQFDLEVNYERALTQDPWPPA